LVPQPLEGSNQSLIQLRGSYSDQVIHYRLRHQPGNGGTAEVLDVNHSITERSPDAPLLLVEEARPPLIVLHHGNRLVDEVVPDAPINCRDS
jgi:hypothetical protein